MHPLISPLVGLAFRTLEPLGLRPQTKVRQPFVPPVSVRLAGMLREGKHDSLRFTLNKLHRDSQRSSIEAMLQILDEAEKADQWIERLWRWYRENREYHSMSVLIYGLIKLAWQKRGRGPAEALPAKLAEGSREAFEEAERLLDKALAIQPDNTDLLCLRLSTARGLAMDSGESWGRFRALIAIDPGHYRGHLAMLENLKPDWGGSDDAMFRFARARGGQMPLGHPLKALVVLAHFDLRNRRCENNGPDANSYFRAADIGAEIEAAWNDSVNSPQFSSEALADELHNLFAAALYLAGRPDAARTALAMMDACCTPAPWSSMARDPKEQGNPGWVVDRVKAELNPA